MVLAQLPIVKLVDELFHQHIWRNIMQVSSALNSLATVATPNRAEQANEGIKPDGDNDKDDGVQATSSVQQNAPVGASGSIINTVA